MSNYILTEEQKLQLDLLSDQYAEASDEYTSADAKKKAINMIIKQAMSDFGITKYVSGSGVSLSVTTKQNVSFDEDKLLELCKQMNIPNLVKTKEYVDMDVLEGLLYNRVISAEAIASAKVVKPDTVTLRCTKKQALNE